MNLKTNSIGKKIGFLVLITILLQIPLYFINSISYERSNTYDTMARNLGNEWGLKQKISGVFLVAPYEITRERKNEDNETVYEKIKKTHIILPSESDIEIQLNDEIRQRGIYKTSVYNANVKITGNFKNIKEKLLANCDEIYIALGINSVKSLTSVAQLKVLGQDLKPIAGTNSNNKNLVYGISALLNESILQNDNIDYDITFTLRGSQGIDIVPLADKNIVNINSLESKPSFYGTLPNTKEIKENGFIANYEITPFTRNFQKDINEMDTYLDDNMIGVNLYQGVTHYRQVIRAAKYSMLFIMLSLFVVYIFEFISKKATHYIQYGVVGFSLTLFYLVLLSMSEYFGFEFAYIIATLMVAIPNALYIKAITKNTKYGLGMLAFLGGVYAVLFSVLQMEQFALITGTILIMLVLYAIMYITRNIDNFIEKQE